MKNRKKIFSILSIAIIASAFIITMLPLTQATDPADWYTTVSGVLDIDYYALYQF